MKYLEYDKFGEIVGCHDVVPVELQDSVLEVSQTEAERVLSNPRGFRINQVDGELKLSSVEKRMVKPQTRLTEQAFAGGVVVNGVCYATNANAMSILNSGSNPPVAIVHTHDRDKLVEIDGKTRAAIVAALLKQVRDSL